jgi:hypothetical protein
MNLFEVNPLGMVVQVRLMLGIDDLLNDLLRALSMRNGKRERECS